MYGTLSSFKVQHGSGTQKILQKRSFTGAVQIPACKFHCANWATKRNRYIYIYTVVIYVYMRCRFPKPFPQKKKPKPGLHTHDWPGFRSTNQTPRFKAPGLLANMSLSATRWILWLVGVTFWNFNTQVTKPTTTNYLVIKWMLSTWNILKNPFNFRKSDVKADVVFLPCSF